uniref:Homeobox domain-containing protein n=1 Tax=Panagrellus redivivus TaxID=6233 RepID=A0A7E4VTH2_PANRE
MDSSALFNAYLNTVLRQTYAPMAYLAMPMFGLPMMPTNVIGNGPTPHAAVPMPQALPIVKPLQKPSALPSEQSTQPSPLSQAPPTIKTRVEFTAEIKKILHDWFDAHLDYPYPSKHDVQLLTEKTPLTKTQVMTWCTNRRRSYEKQHGHVKWAKKAAPACAGKKRSAAQRDAAEPAKKMARISID